MTGLYDLPLRDNKGRFCNRSQMKYDMDFENWFYRNEKRASMEKFWECYVEGTDGGKHHKHHTLESAEIEAERLARFSKGRTVYLFECIGKCKAEQLPVKWEILR